MTARELLTKVTAVFHSHIKRATGHQQLRKAMAFTFRAVQKVSNDFKPFQDAVLVLVYALVKEHARPYETL
jgi:hypothetical protein